MGWNDGTITACYATGNVDGEVNIGGLVGRNQGGTITACYATGNANTEGVNLSTSGGWWGIIVGTITACYGFGTASGGIIKMPRSDDASAPATVGSASALTMVNSSTIETNRWSARVWDFGTESQVPGVKMDHGL